MFGSYRNVLTKEVALITATQFPLHSHTVPISQNYAPSMIEGEIVKEERIIS
jgi:hypothetical protein